MVGKGSAGFPVLHPLREFAAGDDYLTKFAVDGSELVYSTPVGARDIDVFVAASGTKILVAGKISSGSLPVLRGISTASSSTPSRIKSQRSNPGLDSRLWSATPHREEDVPDGWAGPHPGYSEVGVLKAHDDAEGTVGNHPHRSRHQLSLPVG